jgi:hypothetical protein
MERITRNIVSPQAMAPAVIMVRFLYLERFRNAIFGRKVIHHLRSSL